MDSQKPPVIMVDTDSSLIIINELSIVINEHLLMEIARHDEDVWRTFSMLNKPLGKIFNVETREKRFPKKYPDLPLLVDPPQWFTDYSSLYPSHMLAYSISPYDIRVLQPVVTIRITLPSIHVQSSGRVKRTPCARQCTDIKTNQKYQKYNNRKHLSTPQYSSKHSKKWDRPRKWH